MSEFENWSVWKKLARARAILAGKALKKSGVNKQRYQDKKTGEWKEVAFSYFELSDFLPDTLRIFDELGLCGVFTITEAYTEETQAEGRITRTVYPEVAELKVVNVDKSDEYITFREPTAQVEMKTAIQSLGAKKTYLRRYLWIDCMEIAENDIVDAQPSDDDKDNGKTKKQNTQQKEDKPQQKEPQKPHIIDPADMAVELTRLRTELTKGGVDIRSDAFVDYVKKTAQVNTIEPGMLLGDPPAMNRVIQVMRAIIQTKS